MTSGVEDIYSASHRRPTLFGLSRVVSQNNTQEVAGRPSRARVDNAIISQHPYTAHIWDWHDTFLKLHVAGLEYVNFGQARPASPDHLASIQRGGPDTTEDKRFRIKEWLQ